MERTNGSRKLEVILETRKQQEVADDLSAACGRRVWSSNLSKWASGAHTPSPRMMGLMQIVLGIPMTDWPVALTEAA